MGQHQLAVCPGCGLRRPSLGLNPDQRFNASGECRSLMSDLSYYTLAHGHSDFIHQHLVDVYAAQHVRQSKSTIGTAFALTGLYLAVERGFTGHQVQAIHMLMAKKSKKWPPLDPPHAMGPLTVADVLSVEAGVERDRALIRWCESVWTAWSLEHQRIRQMVDRFL